MSDQPPLRDYARSLAVVMGTWDYAFLAPVPAAEHSLRRMQRLLSGPLCGWPQDRLLTLENEPDAGTLPDRLITAFEHAQDVALFYFVGHGQISPDDQLCFGLAQSRPEPNRRAATSLRFSDVRQALQDSPASIKIVILDCCFAGLATKATLGGLADDVLDLTAGTGAYTMAATGAYTPAWYEVDPRIERPQTYFTKYLADAVEVGIPGQPRRLRLDPLFKHVKDRLAADEQPVPHSRAVNDARDFAIAYNAASPEGQRDAEAEQELTRLSQRLAETDAQVQALAVQAAERERELARLQQLLAVGSRDTERQQELQDAIDATAQELHDTRAAQAALTADSSAAPDPASDAQSPPRRPSRRRFLIAGGAIGVLAAAGGGVAAALAAMPHSGGHSPGVVAGRKAFVFITEAYLKPSV
jgi:Caspase domain